MSPALGQSNRAQEMEDRSTRRHGIGSTIGDNGVAVFTLDATAHLSGVSLSSCKRVKKGGESGGGKE